MRSIVQPDVLRLCARCRYPCRCFCAALCLVRCGAQRSPIWVISRRYHKSEHKREVVRPELEPAPGRHVLRKELAYQQMGHFSTETSRCKHESSLTYCWLTYCD